MTEHLLDAAEGKWKLGGKIEVPCIYRFYGPKINKAEFRNKSSKQSNIATNKLVFVSSRCFSAFRQ